MTILDINYSSFFLSSTLTVNVSLNKARELLAELLKTLFGAHWFHRRSTFIKIVSTWLLILRLSARIYLYLQLYRYIRLNPISGRLLATPISGRGGGCLRPPLDISRSNGPIFKIQTAFDFAQRDLHF